MISDSNNGRASNGRFAPGYAGGPGNPGAKFAGRLRVAFEGALTPEDVTAAVEELRKGLTDPSAKIRLAAAREILDRGLGRPVQSTEIAIDYGGAGKIDYGLATPEEMVTLRRIQAELIARGAAERIGDDSRN